LNSARPTGDAILQPLIVRYAGVAPSTRLLAS
jgi:hypothetical protein